MEKRFKIMHVAECVGGVDRFLRNLLKYTDHSKVNNIMILSQLYDKKIYEDLADKVEIIDMQHSMGFSAFKTSLQLRKKIKEYKPDIVFGHSSIAGAITRLACIGLTCKVIYNPHGWSFNMESDRRKLFLFLEKIMSLFCDKIVCISDAEKKSALENNLCNEDKLVTIYNGIDLSIWPKEISLNLSEDSFVVGMVGRICKQKAPDVFVKMASMVKREVADSVFIIVGDVLEGKESERREIEELAIREGIDLIITGWVDNPLSYVTKFDVGCLLSRWEGFGLVIPEYMFCEKPIVATNVDAIPYLIEDGVNGLLVDKDDWEEAAFSVIELYRNNCLRDTLIRNGKKTVKQFFDARRVAKEYENLYQSLLKS